MNIFDLIKNLRLDFSWSKRTGVNSNANKVNSSKSHGSVTSGRDSNIQGDIVNGDKYQTIVDNDRHPFIEIQRDTATSSQSTYVVGFRFHNIGESSATIQSFSLAEEPLDIAKKTLAPSDPPYEIQRDITNLKIRNARVANPIARVEYKSLTGKKYATNAVIVQGAMAVPTFNLKNIEDNQLEILNEAEK